MNVMAPTRPTELRGYRVRLSTGPAAAAEARRQVRAAICAWDIPVDPDVAILLTSELVTNAIRHEVTGIVMLAITCSPGQLRVDVHDTSRALPMLIDAAADTSRSRSSPMGPRAADAARRVFRRGHCEPEPSHTGSQSPLNTAAWRPITSTRWCARRTRGRYRSASGHRASSRCARRGSRRSAGRAAAGRRSPGWTIPPPRTRRS
jgi:hypothetical protein